MSIPLRKSIYDAQVAKLRAKYPGKLGDEAVNTYSEGFEVLPDSDPVFNPAPARQAAPQSPAAPVSGPIDRSSLIEAAARIVELTGVDKDEAMKRAEAAEALRSGAPQTIDEYAANDPEFWRRDGNVNADGTSADPFDITEEQGQAMLAAAELKSQRKAHDKLKYEAEDMARKLRDIGVSEAVIEASVNGFLVEQGVTPRDFRLAEAKAVGDMTSAELQASVKALPRSAFGLADEE